MLIASKVKKITSKKPPKKQKKLAENSRDRQIWRTMFIARKVKKITSKKKTKKDQKNSRDRQIWQYTK